MPDDPTQYFLVTVEKMCTSPDADLVGRWSAVIASEDLHKFTLPLGAEAANIPLKDCPIPGVRPMTEAEIAEWRNAPRD